MGEECSPSTQIIPASVHIKSLADPESLRVLEQNYEYDLLSPQKLMDKYVGKEVRLYQKNPYTEREEVVIATLLSTNNGAVFQGSSRAVDPSFGLDSWPDQTPFRPVLPRDACSTSPRSDRSPP